VCRQLRDGLAQPRSLAPRSGDVALHLSFGISSYPPDALAAEDLIGVADRNLHASKGRGRGGITAHRHGVADDASSVTVVADPGAATVPAGR
jgi:GGDEF domain-containing protein